MVNIDTRGYSSSLTASYWLFLLSGKSQVMKVNQERDITVSLSTTGNFTYKSNSSDASYFGISYVIFEI